MYNIGNEIMKLKIYKIGNKFSFTVGDFSSIEHSALIKDCKANYDYAWEANKIAKNIISKNSIHLEVLRKTALEDMTKPVRTETGGEDFVINHFKKTLNEMTQRTKWIDDDPVENKEKEYLVLILQVETLLKTKETMEDEGKKAEIDALISGYRKLVKKHFSSFLEKDRKAAEEEKAAIPEEPAFPDAPQVPEMPEEGAPEAPNLTMASIKEIISSSEAKEVLEHYSDKILQAISKHHKDAIPRINEENYEIDVICAEGDHTPIMKIKINNNLHVDGIIPSGKLSKSFPAFSNKFYQRYWKPIVESVGHFYLDEFDTFILPEKTHLPDMPTESKECEIKGCKSKEDKIIPLSLKFDVETPMWSIAKKEGNLVKVAQEVPENTPKKEFLEEDFINNQPARVKCIDQNLDLFGKIGEVVQVIPINAGQGFEVDVNFGRKIVRLSQNQVEIVNGV